MTLPLQHIVLMTDVFLNNTIFLIFAVSVLWCISRKTSSAVDSNEYLYTGMKLKHFVSQLTMICSRPLQMRRCRNTNRGRRKDIDLQEYTLNPAQCAHQCMYCWRFTNDLKRGMAWATRLVSTDSMAKITNLTKPIKTFLGMQTQTMLS